MRTCRVGVVVLLAGLLGACASAPPFDGAAVKADIDQGFGMTTWWPSVTRIHREGDTAVLDTSLYPDSDATEPGKSICGGASGYFRGEHPELGVTGVTVRSSTGSTLASSVGYTPC